MTPAEREAARKAAEVQYNRARDADLREQAPMRKAIRAHRREEQQKKRKS